MATSVAQPLERQIAQIPGVSQMTSTSSLGATAITVQFDLDRNIDAAANDIQAAINAASGQLPKDLPSPPTYRKVNPSDTPILILSVAVRRRADHRSRRFGGKHPRPAHQPDLRRLAGARRRPADARRSASRSIRRSSSRRTCSSRTCGRRSASRPSTAPRARSWGQTQSFTIYDNDQLTTAKPWNDVIIAYRNGAPVRMRDIGQAVIGAGRHDSGGLEQRQARACFWSFSSSRARTSSTPSTRSRRP